MTIVIVAVTLVLFACAVFLAILLVRGGSQAPVVGDFNPKALTRVLDRHERDQVGRD